MIFFMTRKKFEEQMEAYCEEIKKQCDLKFDRLNQMNQTMLLNDKKLEERMVRLEEDRSLYDEIRQLKSNHNILLNELKKQNADILALNSTVCGLKKELAALEYKLKEARAAKQEKEAEPQTVLQIEALFCEEADQNIRVIEHFIRQTKNLKERLLAEFSDSESIELCIKLVDKCAGKMERLLSKNEQKELSSDQLANECAKILKQTIARAMSQKKLKHILDQYMQDCKLRKLNWTAGKKLEEEDFDYLEEPILYEDVSDREQKNTIRDVLQDTYIIDYMEDDMRYEAIIPGIYCIGRYQG